MDQPAEATGPQAPPQYSLPHSLILHLAPGAVFTAFIVLASELGLDPGIALFGGIGVVLVPVELGYLAIYSHRTTGTWSPWGAVTYTHRPARRELTVLAGSLAAWFLFVLVISIALIDGWLAENVFGWMPESLLQFASPQGDNDPLGKGEAVAFVTLAVVFNGIAGPVTEELYFRGHLLPRLERYGGRAAVINTVLFALYHFFSPWRYPAIIVGFLPITWMAMRKRSIYVSMAAHVTINMVTILLLTLALAADG